MFSLHVTHNRGNHYNKLKRRVDRELGSCYGGEQFVTLQNKRKRNRNSHIFYDTRNRIVTEKWTRVSDGVPHRVLDSGPAYVSYDRHGTVSQMWVVNGDLHRVHGPAVRCKSVDKWYDRDCLHRENGPAVIRYFESGQVQREEWVHFGTRRNFGLNGTAIT